MKQLSSGSSGSVPSWRSLGFYSAQPISRAARFEYALDRLPPPAFTAYGLQSIIQHVAHFPVGSGA
jgi:hypothetical protein